MNSPSNQVIQAVEDHVKSGSGNELKGFITDKDQLICHTMYAFK